MQTALTRHPLRGRANQPDSSRDRTMTFLISAETLKNLRENEQTHSNSLEQKWQKKSPQPLLWGEDSVVQNRLSFFIQYAEEQRCPLTIAKFVSLGFPTVKDRYEKTQIRAHFINACFTLKFRRIFNNQNFGNQTMHVTIHVMMSNHLNQWRNH